MSSAVTGDILVIENLCFGPCQTCIVPAELPTQITFPLTANHVGMADLTPSRVYSIGENSIHGYLVAAYFSLTLSDRFNGLSQTLAFVCSKVLIRSKGSAVRIVSGFFSTDSFVFALVDSYYSY
jgi:hypothetical protein